MTNPLLISLKKILTIAILSLLSLSSKATSSTDQSNHDRYLFVQSASQATLTKNPKEPGSYLITLRNISPFVTYFTERPVRKAGLLAINKLLSLWEVNDKEGFKKNPPNADINASFLDDAGSEQWLNFIVILTDPIYNSETKTLTYKIQSIAGSPSAIPEAKDSNHATLDLNHVTLFIDDVCLNCWFPH